AALSCFTCASSKARPRACVKLTIAPSPPRPRPPRLPRNLNKFLYTLQSCGRNFRSFFFSTCRWGIMDNILSALPILMADSVSTRSAPSELFEGAYYSIVDGETFSIAKVLKLEAEIVHVRIYKQHFQQRPR